MTKIITHDGKGHQDDFLATCVCIHQLNAPAFRAKCLEEQLLDSDNWVLDQGNKFEPELHNFDHHQLKKEICSLTMVLDYFYGENYREYLPQLRFIEILDSYGSKKAAEFAQTKLENFETISSPIASSIIRIFSKIDGEIVDPFYSIMKEIGKDLCEKIEETQLLLMELENSKILIHENIKILDVSCCKVPKNCKHDILPTKLYCKKKNINPEVILSKDSRQNGFRMISINTDGLKFIPCEKSYYTHVSGVLTGFENYEDYKFILDHSKNVNSNNL